MGKLLNILAFSIFEGIMDRRIFKFFLFLTFTFHVALAVNLKRILRAIEKGDYVKAIEFLEEEIKEEPVNPGAYFIYADLLSVDTLPYYDLDKAREYIRIAINQYDTVPEDIIEELEKANIRLFSLENTYDQIRKKTFERSLSLNTLEAYNAFINLYPNSEQTYTAIDKRDSIAYENAKAIHTWEAYRSYVDTYPQSRFKPIAAVRYQRLLYLDRTKSGSLEDLENFVANHPDNPYVNEVIEEILKKRTLQNRVNDYRLFIADYPDSPSAKKAIDILYHLDPELFFKLPELKLFNRKGRYDYKDSITLIHEKNLPSLVAFVENGKTGLLTTQGKTFMNPAFEEIYLSRVYCEPFTKDIIAGKSGEKDLILNRISENVYSGDFEEVKDLGQGVLWTNSGKVIHKSGFVIYENIEDAQVFDESVLLLKKGKKWALGTFTGLELTPFRFDDIYLIGKFWAFEKEGLIALTSKEKFFYEGFAFEYKYDDLELVSDEIIIGFNKEKECLVGSELNFLIPWGDHTIYPDSLVYYAKNKGGSYIIYNRELTDQLGEGPFRDVLVSENWLAAEKDWWRVMNLKEQQVLLKQFDSVKIINDHALYASFADSSRIYFPNGSNIQVEEGQQIYSVATSDKHIQFVMISNEDSKEKTLYNQYGLKVLSGEFDEIAPLSGGLFKIEKNNKQGVMDILGNIILEPEYELIQQKNQIISTLQNGKIGSYDLKHNILFEPEYESAFVRIGPFYSTTMDGKQGLLDSLKNQVTEFEFNEIKPLSDSLFWARTDSSWQVMKVGLSLPMVKGISSFEEVQTREKRFFQVLTRSGYGMISEKGEQIFNPSFSDINIMDHGEEVIIRAEKYFIEADYYIVVWYNQYGKKIFSGAYRGKEFEPLYCE